MINGEQRCFTFDYKPSALDISKIIAENSKGGKESVRHAVSDYITIKEAVLSPSTIKMYKSYFRNMPEDFLNLKLRELDQVRKERVWPCRCHTRLL